MSTINYLSAIDLENTDDYQSLYSSQLYGTFFSIYGKFTTKKKNSHFEVEMVELKVINYKGVVNLGITKAELESVQLDASKKISKEVVLKLAVKAGFTNSVDFEVLISKDSKNIQSNAMFYVERYLDPMHGGVKPTNAICDGIFDSEFFFREGLFKNSEALRTSHIPKLWIDRSEAGKTSGTGGSICPYNILKVK